MTAIIQLAEQIAALEAVVKGEPYSRDAVKQAVQSLGVFAEDADAYRAYAKRLRAAKRERSVVEVLTEFPGAFVSEINDV